MVRHPQQFVTLDALRGIAAVAVMLFHASPADRTIMPGGYLAVDLFFLMSGFVIAQAYHARLVAGMEIRAFLWRRAVRLWPMLALGAALGIALQGGHAGSLLLLPDWRSPGNLFPANPPLWSLLFEWLAYIAFAAALWRLTPRGLAAVVAASTFLLVNLAMSGNAIVDFGAHWSNLAGGLARLGFGFAGGILAWHWWAQRPCPPHKSWAALVPILAAVAIMAFVPTDGGIAAIAAILIGGPAILWAALQWDLPAPALARRLGDLSYPLYCIHAPLLPLVAATPILLTLFVPLALCLHHWIDLPARRWLAARILPAGDQTRIGMST